MRPSAALLVLLAQVPVPDLAVAAWQSSSALRGGADRVVDPAVTRGELEADVSWLAADERRGRETGSPEAVEAARWLAASLDAAGIQPAGDEGFLQAVPLDAQAEYTGLPRLILEAADGTTRAAVWGVDLDRVWGVVPAAELELLVVRGASDVPAEASASRALLVEARGREQRELLAGLDAGWGLVLLRGSSRAGGEARSEPQRAGRIPEGPPRLRVRGPFADELAAAGGGRVRVHVPGERVERPAYNVVGILPGVGTAERPELAGEAIVLSAHYDHIGVRSDVPEGEDAVFNGADDDASGCAAVLELAEALAAGPAPARTVVFLLATGEEIGLVGTRHYLERPVVPLERTVANINFEMIGRPDALAGGSGTLWLTGWERTNLGPAFAGLGLAVVPDPRPAQGFFERSDNYAFAVRGIVAQSLSSYDLHTDYHRVSDEVSKLDWEHMQAAVRDALEGVRALADGALDPAWAPGGSPAR